MFMYLIFAKNRSEAKVFAQEMNIGKFWIYAGSTYILNVLDPSTTKVLFAPGWHENRRSDVLFEKAHALGLMNLG